LPQGRKDLHHNTQFQRKTKKVLGGNFKGFYERTAGGGERGRVLSSLLLKMILAELFGDAETVRQPGAFGKYKIEGETRTDRNGKITFVHRPI